MNHPHGEVTILDLLVMLIIVAFVSTVVFLALDPLKQARERRDISRYEGISLIADTLAAYREGHKGAYPSPVDSLKIEKVYVIGTSSGDCSSVCAGYVTEPTCVSLDGLVAAGSVNAIPMDPVSGTPEVTGYFLKRKKVGTIEVGVCQPEHQAEMVVQR